MSDPHLDAIIAWVREMNQDRLAAQKTQAAEPVVPTFPDRGVILPEADRRAAHAIEDFVAKIRLGERPELLLRETVGAGKSAAAIAQIPNLLSAARTAGHDGAIYIFVPRHDLGDELLARTRDTHPSLKVEIWRGMDQPDRDAPPEDPLRTMCADRTLSGAAMVASQSATAGCKVCPWFAPKGGASLDSACAYIRQTRQRPDIWLMPHNLMFQRKFPGLPDAAVAIVDEAFVSAALAGTDPLHPVQLTLSSLDDTRTGALIDSDRERLLYLRRVAREAIGMQDANGGLQRDAFLAVGFAVYPPGTNTPDTAAEWAQLEWMAKPEPKIIPGMSRDAAIAAFNHAAEQGFTKLRPMLAVRMRDLLRSTDACSVNATLIRGAALGGNQGTADVIRFAWREDFGGWIASAPKLFLDATTRTEVLRCWAPDLQEVDIEVKAPGQRVRQIIGAEFGRTRFTQNAGNVRRLGDLVVTELAATRGDVLVIAQQAVEELLRIDLERRLGTIPDRLKLAHHGDITGIDAWRSVARMAVVGRPATNRTDGERHAEVLRGTAVAAVEDGDADRWPVVTAGIRLANGTGHAVRQPRHPDELVEATRWSITEGAVVQAIGRCRGVRRDPANPVFVTVLAELALPLDVDEVATWDDARPGRIHVAAAEAAITGNALPLAAADLHLARPDLFPSEVAAAHAIKREKGGQTLIKKEGLPYKEMAPLSDQRTAQYRKAGGRGSLATALVPVEGGRAALEAVVGPLSAYEPMMLPVQPAEPSDLHADIEPAALFPAGTLGAEPPDILLRLPSGAHLGILPPPSRGPSMPMTHGLRVASDGRWARLPERLPARVIVAA